MLLLIKLSCYYTVTVRIRLFRTYFSFRPFQFSIRCYSCSFLCIWLWHKTVSLHKQAHLLALCASLQFFCAQEAMPFAVVGSDKEYQVNGKRVLGRKTAWGIVEGVYICLLGYPALSGFAHCANFAHFAHARIYRLLPIQTQTAGWSDRLVLLQRVALESVEWKMCCSRNQIYHCSSLSKDQL